MITSAIKNIMPFIRSIIKRKVCTRHPIFEVSIVKKLFNFSLVEGQYDGLLGGSKTNLSEKHYKGR